MTLVFSIASISDSEILAALQTAVRTQRHRLDTDKFAMFSVGWTWYWKEYFGVEAGTVVVNSLYYQEEDNGVLSCRGSEGSRWSGSLKIRSWQMYLG